MSHLMLGFARNELAAPKRRRVIKVGLWEIKNCSCLPSFPPSTDEVEVEWKVKGAGFEKKGRSHTAFDEFIFTACMKDNLG